MKSTTIDNATLRPEAFYQGTRLTPDAQLIVRRLNVFYKQHGHLHSTRNKVISKDSQQGRYLMLKKALLTLHRIGHPVTKLERLNRRRLRVLFRHWESEGRSGDYLQNHASALRFLCRRLKREEVFPKPSAELLANPENWIRRRRTRENTVEAANGDLESVIEAVRTRDPVVAHMLELEMMFGLRVQEAVMFRALEADRGDHLLVDDGRGAKGNRPRCILLFDFTIDRIERSTGTVIIRDITVREDAIRLLGASKAMSRQNICAGYPNGTLIPPHRTKKWGYNHYRRLVREAGMTKADLGFTSHSLRHSYASRRYAVFSDGLLPGYRRGDALPTTEDVRVDRAANQICAILLGHNDPSTTPTYVGPPTEIAERHLGELLRAALIGNIKEPIIRITQTGRAVATRGRDIAIINPDSVANFELLDVGKLPPGG
jgi:integrase